MNLKFPLFQSHLDRAHEEWRRLVAPGDIIIDATCGNGQDALFLALLALCSTGGQLYVMDIQSKAIEVTQNLLSKNLPKDLFHRVTFLEQCHSSFPSTIAPETVKLIVYNLGYLPKGDKRRTTRVETTLASLERALLLIKPGGVLSVTAYPGHTEGLREQEHLLDYFSKLNTQQWSCSYQQWINRLQAPTLLLIQKASQPLVHSNR